MTKVIGVRFRTGARIYSFDPLDIEFAQGDGVIVETARGLEYGAVASCAAEVPDESIVQPLKPVVRKATDEDTRMRDENSAKEDNAFSVCERKIAEHSLDMKLVDVEYTFNGSKVVFYFTADERVDFRELVKDLASQFRTRIELRQIGVRDEAKMLGGLGSCGRPVCCRTFLDDFKPVSIKMAKEQNLSLSPTKISGLCGRLMCCLQYEQSTYEEIKKRMPRTGKEIVTPDGSGIAVENNAITEKTKVRLTLPDGTIEVREYHYTRLAKPGEPLPVPPPSEPEAMPKEAERAAEPVYIPRQDGPAATAPGADGGQKPNVKRRRRRGGRGGKSGRPQGNGEGAQVNGGSGAQTNGGGAQANGGGAQVNAGGGAQTPRGPAQPEKQRQQPQPNKPRPQPQPEKPRPQPQPDKAGAEQQPKHRRRRRGGAKPRPATPEKTT